MSYQIFLTMMSQLAGKKRARVVYQEQTIYIDKGAKEKHWILSTPVFYGERGIPSYIRGHLSSSGRLQWETKGPYLQVEPETHQILLCQEMEPSMKYIPFRTIIDDFVDVANEWREILEMEDDRLLSV